MSRVTPQGGIAGRRLQRTFTLREAAALLDVLPADGSMPGEDGPARARALVMALDKVRSQRHGGEDDDVADAIGGPLEAHDESGQAIVAALLPLPLLDGLAGGDTTAGRRGTAGGYEARHEE